MPKDKSTPDSPRHPALDPVLITGVLASAGISVLCYFRTDVPTLLALLAALIGVAVTLQVQLLLKEQRQDAQLGKQRELLANLECVDWLPDSIHRQVGSVVRIQRNYPGLASAAALRGVFDVSVSRLKDLERGHVLVDFDDMELLYDLTKSCKTALRATSVQGVDLSFWLSPQGRQYWSLHLDALRRGVAIERIFVYDDWNAELAELAREQVGAGVRVLRVERRTLPARLCNDMILWDDLCGYESRQNAGGEATDNFFTFDEQDVARMDAHYAVVVSCSQTVLEEQETCAKPSTPLSVVPTQGTSSG